MSAVAHCKLDGFSVERLMTFLTALDQAGSPHERSEMRDHKPGGQAFAWPLIPDFALLLRQLSRLSHWSCVLI
jgi:hypothetical protein